VIEPTAGEYELRVELDGVLIGCAGEYLSCANPFSVTVAPRPPVAANSRLRAPATHVLQVLTLRARWVDAKSSLGGR
jgi:hypothetical protein